MSRLSLFSKVRYNFHEQCKYSAMVKMCTMNFLFLIATSHKKWNIFYESKFKNGKIFADQKKRSEAYSEHRRTFKMELFPKNYLFVNYFRLKAPS